MDIISGEVKRIVHRNKENGYIVFLINEMICTGYLENVKVGDILSLEGEYVSHPQYGRQFQVVSRTTLKKDSVSEIEAYLGSGQFKGIGKAIAKRIVDTFGKDTFKIMEFEPLKLAIVKGITCDRAKLLSEQVLREKVERDAFIFLQKYGISTYYCNLIYKKYKDKCYSIISQNPYQLMYDIKGIGFTIADNIAQKVGIAPDSHFRMKAGIVYCLEQDVTEKGNTFMYKERLLQSSSDFLKIEPTILEPVMHLLEAEQVISVFTLNDASCVCLNSMEQREFSIVEKILDLNYVRFTYDMESVENIISDMESVNGYFYDELQKKALKKAIINNVLIICGVAGCGKTTTINLLIGYFERKKKRIVLSAPTGRASKRMTEATGREAVTIHRLLEAQAMSDGRTGDSVCYFNRNEKNSIDADVIIIDEMSMVDMYLFLSLLKAVKKGTKLILVGDENQLPSVGAGQVLRDLIASDCFSVMRLKKTFRQDIDSNILINANRINEGLMPDFDNKSNDYIFKQVTNQKDMFYTIVEEIKHRAIELKVFPTEVQVLTPFRKGTGGVESLNPRLQAYFNPESLEKQETSYKDVIYREGDKVMHIKNCYTMQTYITSKKEPDILIRDAVGVFNGEIGIIVEINRWKEEILVKYEDFYVFYKFNELDLLEHAFALTIHKTQGCEYDAVILAVMTDSKLLTINLLYTAVTRARKLFSVVGNESVIKLVIREKRTVKRLTGLCQKLKKYKNCSDELR